MLAGVGIMCGRRKGQVKTQLEGLFNHVGDNSVDDRTCTVQTGVGIDLNQPGLEVPINHEIQPKNLEVVHLSLGNLGEDTLGSISGYLSHFWQDLLPEVVLLGGE